MTACMLRAHDEMTAQRRDADAGFLWAFYSMKDDASKAGNYHIHLQPKPVSSSDSFPERQEKIIMGGGPGINDKVRLM